MISKKHKFLFIHIPKTAGTSVYYALGGNENEDTLFGYRKNLDLDLQHMTPGEYIKYGFMTELEFRDYFKFCFVRNPWDRVVSEWLWRTKHVPRHNLHRYFKLSLKSFLIKVPTWRGKAGSGIRRHMMPQHSFIYSNEDKLMVDFVGRFENLEEDFNHICHQLSLTENDLPWLNITKQNKVSRDYRRYYDEETYQMVKELYIKDIEYFKYEF